MKFKATLCNVVRIYLKIKSGEEGGELGCSSLIEYLPSMLEALGSIPSTRNTKASPQQHNAQHAVWNQLLSTPPVFTVSFHVKLGSAGGLASYYSTILHSVRCVP